MTECICPNGTGERFDCPAWTLITDPGTWPDHFDRWSHPLGTRSSHDVPRTGAPARFAAITRAQEEATR